MRIIPGKVNLRCWLATKADHVALPFSLVSARFNHLDRRILLKARGRISIKVYGKAPPERNSFYSMCPRYIKGWVNRSFRLIKGPKRLANAFYRCEIVGKTLCFCDLLIFWIKCPYSRYKGMQSWKLGMWKGYQLPIKTKLNARLVIRQKADLYETNISALALRQASNKSALCRMTSLAFSFVLIPTSSDVWH